MAEVAARFTLDAMPLRYRFKLDRKIVDVDVDVDFAKILSNGSPAAYKFPVETRRFMAGNTAARKSRR